MKALKTMKSQLIESCPPPKDNSNIITITQRLDSSAVYDLAKKLANEKIVTLNLPGADLAIDDLLILSGSLKKMHNSETYRFKWKYKDFHRKV